MLNTILGIIGWVGTMLVFLAVAIRLFRPEWDQYAYWAAIGGLVCVASTRSASGAKSFDRSRSAKRSSVP